ncbi:hypothetical protein DFJ74DRAFT_665542 [Hyaloraphidium curvatum]|nr:hypothetical protein DFJ74DRAFT_665542 [Hyaloraphidium curvatum]
MLLALTVPAAAVTTNTGCTCSGSCGPTSGIGRAWCETVGNCGLFEDGWLRDYYCERRHALRRRRGVANDIIAGDYCDSPRGSITVTNGGSTSTQTGVDWDSFCASGSIVSSSVNGKMVLNGLDVTSDPGCVC